ncbi:HTH domain-containing protein [Fusobacterium animalis]|uniref:HTH domain-containing protein n=1 Tax=Fusobacterium animalis TaxID=76859 RepID=UPI001C6ECB5A|nr:HTH domain-containing protein [Fusobacterium animalis]QYR63514.1 HTH domain-containing protein [Fusobacterium animalis]
MIKLAILTPKNSYEKIKKSLKDIECEVKYIFYNNLYDLENLYLKNAQKYDGIITSGPIGYEIIKNSVELLTPLYHFDISKGDLYKYLFNILKENPKIDFSRVYIDFISPEKKEYWFQDIFKKEEEPIFYKINFSNKNLYETLKNNYTNLKNNKKIDIVLTRISNMVEFLKNEKISFDFLFPSEENIKNTVLEVIKDIKILKSEKKQIIFGKLLLNEVSADIEEEIHSVSKNCIVKILDKSIEILMIYEDFINSNIALNLKKKLKMNFFSGWGKGNNINEARYNAEKAYKKSKETNFEVVYLVSTNSEIILSEIDDEKKKNIEIIEKLKELNITKQNSEKLIELFRSKEKVSCASLATYLDISERTANRLLVKLEENNLAISNLIKISRGRPKKLYQLLF